MVFWWTWVTTTERNQWRLRVVSEVDSWTSCLWWSSMNPWSIPTPYTGSCSPLRFEMLSLSLSRRTLSSVPYTHSRCFRAGEDQRPIRRLNTPTVMLWASAFPLCSSNSRLNVRHSLDSQIRQSGRESKSLIELGRSESTLFLKPCIYIDIISRICQQPRSQCPRKLTGITA